MNFDETLLRTNSVLSAGADIGFLEAAGKDARSWLQNLGTNDFRPLKPGDGCETFFTNHKARTIAHAVVHCVRDDAFLLAVESGRAAALFQHLNRYLISEQVELTQLDWRPLRLVGPDARRILEDALQQPVALSPWQSVTIDGAFVRRQGALHVPGFDVVDPKNRLSTVPEIAADALEAIRIESGWPRWGQEMDENRFVVELGRTATAISYAKGCYLGQEPIVMARDRGQVNRHLFGFKSNVEVPVGASVMKGEVEQFKVTSCAFSPAWNAFVGLAYVYRGAGSTGDTITVSGGASVTLCSLPMIPG